MFMTYDTTSYPAYATVSNGSDIGFAISLTELEFGSMPVSGKGARTLMVNNTRDVPIRLKISSMGSISDYLEFQKNDIILQPDENITVDITFSADGEPGDYNGTVLVTTVVPKSPMFAYLL